MTDQVFGSLVSFADVETSVLNHYKLWMHTWLSARERHVGLPVNTIARPRSYIVKQTFSALPGEEQTPIVIAVSDGFAVAPQRRGTGDYDALFRFGIAVVCLGASSDARELCGHYQAAVVGIATHHRRIGGDGIRMDDFANLRIEDIDIEAQGRSLMAVRMEVVYRVESFANEVPAPTQPDPPDNPEDPVPDPKTVGQVLVDVNNYKANESLEEVGG